jgi:hypothetical protein
MRESSALGTDVVEVVLEGGPASFPTELRTRLVARDTEKIKVPYCGGYQHFERLPMEAVAHRPVIFRWTQETRIAE